MPVLPIPKHQLHLVRRAPRPPVQSEQVRQLIADHVRQVDEVFFAHNPGEYLRIRFLIPGETPYPIPPQYTHLAVLRIGDGIAFKVACDAETADLLRGALREVAA